MKLRDRPTPLTDAAWADDVELMKQCRVQALMFMWAMTLAENTQ